MLAAHVTDNNDLSFYKPFKQSVNACVTMEGLPGTLAHILFSAVLNSSFAYQQYPKHRKPAIPLLIECGSAASFFSNISLYLLTTRDMAPLNHGATVIIHMDLNILYLQDLTSFGRLHPTIHSRKLTAFHRTVCVLIIGRRVSEK